MFQTPGNMREEPDSRHDLSGYLTIRDYAPVPGALILGRDRRPCASFVGAKYLFSFTTGETFSAKRARAPAPHGKMVREQAATAGLAPMRVRTSQPEGCFAQRSIRVQSPLTVINFPQMLAKHFTGGISGGGASLSTRSNRSLRHPAKVRWRLKLPSANWQRRSAWSLSE